MSQPPKDPRDWRRAVPIDRYATMLAHVTHYGPEKRGAVLERFGMDEASWRTLDAVWCKELEEVVRRQQANFAMQFASVFARTRTLLAKEQPPVDRVGDAPREPEPPPLVAPSAEPAVQPAQPLVPSYKLEQRATPGLTSFQPQPPAVMPSPAAEDVAGTADISAFVPRAPLPFSPPASGAPPAVALAPAAPPEPPAGSGTADVTSFVAQAAMPFGAPTPHPHAPPGDAPGNPRMRLIRFDPQTGQPLAEPRWVAMPPEPGAPTKR
jgi:hypothetical protein